MVILFHGMVALLRQIIASVSSNILWCFGAVTPLVPARSCSTREETDARPGHHAAAAFVDTCVDVAEPDSSSANIRLRDAQLPVACRRLQAPVAVGGRHPLSPGNRYGAVKESDRRSKEFVVKTTEIDERKETRGA
ncbi:hypothetical protein BHE74_00042442 [Ensete ventricosum]|nr:hypothetical protein GW17_00052110 [Ensete ventricosum]RWW51237.1 hypothetical protein BHE74_00042442 [Ensete ventricosum]